MARPQRRTGESSEPAVKLFVISSAWPYKPTHSPLHPLVLLHGATGPAEFSGPEGACHQHVELACSVLRPEHDLLFVIDVSEVASPQDWQAELGRPGRARRMLERWFAKFNPRKATVLALGSDAELWVPLVRLHEEQRVSKLIVVGEPPCQKSAAQLEAGNVEICVLGRSPSSEALLDAVGTQSWPSGLDFNDLYFTYVDFDINRRTKQLVQNGQNISGPVAESFRSSAPAFASQDPPQPVSSEIALQKPAPAEPYHIPAEIIALLNEADPDLSHGISSTQFLAPGTSVSGVIVIVQSCSHDWDANVLRAVLADTHGSVEGIFSRSMSALLAPGRVVIVSGRTVSLEGRLLLLGQKVSPHHGLRDGYKPVSDGRRNVSEVSRRYGCLILRGRKCVLARDANKQLYVPTDELRHHETAQQAAARAVAEACDIYPEEFAVLRDVAPAIFYDKADVMPIVITIFAAIATNPPPPGSAEDQDTIEDEDDMYDWFPYVQALSRLTSEKERHAITRLAADVASAVDAGIVTTDIPCTFGAGAELGSLASIPTPPAQQGSAWDMPQQSFVRARGLAGGYGRRYGACSAGCC